MSVEVTLRVGKASDVQKIADFNVSMAMETEGKPLCDDVVLAGVRGLIERPQEGFYVVAQADGEIVASLMVTKEWSDWRNGVFWWVQSVYVIPAWRKKGVFRRLYEFVKELALESGEVCGLRLYVEKDNTAAQQTYLKLGMEETPYKMYEAMF